MGKGVKTQEEVDALAIYLFGDDQGFEEVLAIDEKIGRLPGLEGIQLMSKAVIEARERTRLTEDWGQRLIENEGWAIAAPKHSPIGELTTRRGRGLIVEAD